MGLLKASVMNNSLRAFLIVVLIVFTTIRLIYRLSTGDGGLWSAIVIVAPALVLIVVFLRLTNRRKKQKDWDL